MNRLIHFEYTRPGREPTEYRQWLVHDSPEVKVVLLERHEGKRLAVGDRTILEPAAPVIWFVFPDAWYDIGAFHLADGTFTGWYTNFCTPVSMHDDRWSCTDLFLDLWVWECGSYQWLDEAEFVTSISDRTIDHLSGARVARDREVIQQELDGGTWPPDVVRQFDLPRVLSLRTDRRGQNDAHPNGLDSVI